MAGYEFVIKNEGRRVRKAVASESISPEAGKPGTTQSKDTATLVAGIVATKKVKQYIDRAVNYNISTVSLRTGSSREQQQQQFAWNIASGALDLGLSIATGFAVGNVAGAVIGGAVSLINKGISIAQRENTINLEQSIENVSITQTRIRAGAYGSRGKQE